MKQITVTMSDEAARPLSILQDFYPNLYCYPLDRRPAVVCELFASLIREAVARKGTTIKLQEVTDGEETNGEEETGTGG